ncbi:ATP-binding protein [Catenulispora pinisilvae]|uniref:ATP-binding protein n=1 Tax=Catenulispora pinisilvae TaxID=2705253 RepID=UPI0018912902|nr:tetratricopeptide repeat protein [Catenulispora pinisilvae]
MVHEGAHGTHAEVSGRNHRTASARDIKGSSLSFGDTINHYHVTHAMPRRPLAIPADLGDFQNRKSDLAKLNGFLESDKLVCLIAGTAGVGKTALAIKWAHRVKSHFPDGHLYANLGGFTTQPPGDPYAILGEFLPAVGIPAGELPDSLDARSALFRSVLAERRILIVLDNAVAAEQVRPLLPGAGTSRVVVTSRSLMDGLGLQESVVRYGIDVFPAAEAIAMIRAIVGSERAVTDGSSIEEASRLCGSLPLAIRIFSERARNRPLTPLPDLVDTLRDPTTRWRTLSAGDIAVSKAFSASYDDLDETAQQVFRRLGWFPSPEFSIGAAVALTGLIRRDVAQALDDLEAVTLVRRVGPDRYRTHDLLHGFAAEKAAEEPLQERHTAVRRLLNWYLECAAQLRSIAPYEQSAVHVTVDVRQSEIAQPAFASYRDALSWFQNERADLIAVVSLADSNGEYRFAWQVVAALSFAYAHIGHFDDWLTLIRLGTTCAERDGDPAGYAALMAFHGMACKQRGKYDEASEHYRTALDQYQTSNDVHGQAWVQNLLGYLCLAAGRLDQADEAFHTSLTLCHHNGLEQLAILPAEGLGRTARARGYGEAAMVAFEAALAAHQAGSDVAQQFGVLVEMSGTATELHRPDDGVAYATRALEIATRDEVSSRYFEGLALAALGDALHAAGRLDEARVQMMLSEFAGSAVPRNRGEPGNRRPKRRSSVQ